MTKGMISMKKRYVIEPDDFSGDTTATIGIYTSDAFKKFLSLRVGLIRSSMRMSMRESSDLTGLDPSTISRHENENDMRVPAATSLAILAKLSGLSVGQIMGTEEIAPDERERFDIRYKDFDDYMRRGKLSDDEKRQYSKTNVHYKNKLWQLYIRAVTLPDNQRKEIEHIISHALKLIEK